MVDLKISPKKSLGQNFLKNPHIAHDMAQAGEVRPGDMVVEIGPGKGILTGCLLGAGANVLAIEKDDRLIPYLEEKFIEEIKSGRLRVIHNDALKFAATNDQLPVTSYKLVANIPYYITGAIIKRFLALKHPPCHTALLVQKEVAERVVARNGKESMLSISVKIYGSPRVVKIVKAGNFSPAPRVDSAILAIRDISRKNFQNAKDEEMFFALMKLGFAQKRKLLTGNLMKKWDKKRVLRAFEICGIQKKTRAENVSLDQWLCLANLRG